VIVVVSEKENHLKAYQLLIWREIKR